MYTITKWGGKMDSKLSKEFRAEVSRQLLPLGDKTHLPWIKPDGWYSMDYEFVLKSRFECRDTDNCAKLAQDMICRSIGIFDDARILNISARKTFLKGDCEYIRFILRPSNHDWMKYERSRLDVEAAKKAAEKERKRLERERLKAEKAAAKKAKKVHV